jgi:hypothetical protein
MSKTLDLLHGSISGASAGRENVERFTLSFAVFSAYGRMIPKESTNPHVLQCTPAVLRSSFLESAPTSRVMQEVY